MDVDPVPCVKPVGPYSIVYEPALGPAVQDKLTEVELVPVITIP